MNGEFWLGIAVGFTIASAAFCIITYIVSAEKPDER